MHRMNVRFAVAGLFLSALLAVQVFAQPRMPSAEDRADRLKDRLKLTVAQRDSVLAIFKASDQEMRAERGKAQGDWSVMREKMAAIRSDTDKKIEALLTPEQKKEYDVYKTERQNRRQGPRGGVPR